MTERRGSSSSDFVKLYAEQGFALIVLNGKVPLAKKWQKTPPDIELTQDDLPNNYGVVLPANILVIDVDVKKKAPGMASFAQLTKDLKLETGWEKSTFVVKTGTGGFHIYLQKTPELKIRKNLKEYPGIDFLSVGCFVVGVGSIHPDTAKTYDVVFGSPKEICPTPAGLEQMLVWVETLSPEIAKDFIDDDPLNIERFVEIINGMPEAQQGNLRNSCYVTACRGRDLGISLNKCIETMLKYYNPVKLVPPLPDDQLEGTVKNAYLYAKGVPGNMNVGAIFKVVNLGDEDNDLGLVKYDTTAKGVVQKTLNNAVNYLRTVPALIDLFRFNTFNGYIELDSKAPWYKQRGEKGAHINDNDIVLLKFYLSKTVNVEFSQETLLESIIVIGHRRHYHPVRNYLTSLVWDKKSRLDNWLHEYCGAMDNAYTRAVGCKTLCAAVKRVFVPGCKWDHVLILEGAQGIGKSTVCRILGRLWGGDMNLDPHSKDAIHMMLGKWVIELSEMTALKWHDAAALKSFITRECDTARLSYARHAQDFPRQSILIGTVNPEHVGYLSDVTGNRRFWIVNLPGKLDLRKIEDDCDQLWAEAVQRYKSESLYLIGEAETLQHYEALSRMPEDPMRRHVGKYLAENPDVDTVDLVDLLSYVGIPAKNASKADQSRLAQSLVDLKWEKKLTVEDGAVKSVYHRPKSDIIARELEDL